MELLSKYPTGDEFLVTYNPDMQIEYTKPQNLERCYMGTAPVLGVVGRAYGEDVALSWLSIQINNLSEYAGSKDKMDKEKTYLCAAHLKNEFGYMKVTEFMVFFTQMKAGKYGRFYGAVDPIMIAEAMGKFALDRLDTIARYEADAKRKRQAEEDAAHQAEVDAFKAELKARGMTLQEWIAQNCPDLESFELIKIASNAV